MNIFLLSWVLEECVKWYYNDHVIKMILETAQLLSTTWWCLEGETAKSLQQKGRIYKKISNHNHGSAIWARESVENYRLLCDLGIAMCNEYTYRYGKRHKSQDIIEWCKRKRVPKGLESKGLTTFYQAMPDDVKHEDPIMAYRQLYVSDYKVRLAKWKKREKPDWWEPMRKEFVQKKNEQPVQKKRKV
jgi:hypothetical protein